MGHKPFPGERFLGSKKPFLGEGLWGINGLWEKGFLNPNQETVSGFQEIVSGIQETVSGERFMAINLPGERFLGSKKPFLGEGLWGINGLWRKGFWDPRNGFWDPRNSFGAQEMVLAERFMGHKPFPGIRCLGSKKRFLGIGLWDPNGLC
ncbi:hypothetical protein CASFOL_018334 [Castilleja foliolosa]|uniref:Uncharacterized protein n=1 Tax=Castilleja foliolosa TaxID=1961234 RepID=A0ABD3DAA7_9LAMI